MIIVQLSGGMGNQMFQYALGRCLSLAYNSQLKLDVSVLHDRSPFLARYAPFRNYELDTFATTAPIANPSEIPWQFRAYFSGSAKIISTKIQARLFLNQGKEKKLGSFQSDIFDVGPNAYLVGYWQSEKYFAPIANILRKDFTFKNILSKKSQELFDEIRNKKSLCIHIRRADYIDNPMYGVLGMEYYERGMTHIGLETIEKLYVFSDDIAWCQENLRFPVETLFVTDDYGEGRAGDVLRLMSACTYFIIPNSTFSWWAAWLNTDKEKIVIAPKVWIYDGSNNDHFVPESWIRI